MSNWISDEISYDFPAEKKEMSFLQSMVTSIRSIRSRMNIPYSKKINLCIRCDLKNENFIKSQEVLLEAFVNTDNIEISDKIDRPSQSSAIV